MEPEDTGEKPLDNVLDGKARFQAILQLLHLLATLKPGDQRNHHGINPSDTRKSFDFVDAITNLMVRSDEVVAAVAYGARLPTRGIISANLPIETPSHENAQPAPETETESPPDLFDDSAVTLSSDLYDDSTGPYLQVTSVANSNPLPPSGVMLKHKTTTYWTNLRDLKPDEVVPWYDFETTSTSMASSYFDA
jgi:hypothetical protein